MSLRMLAASVALAGLVAAALPEITVGITGDAGLVVRHWLDVQLRGLHELVEAAAGDRVPAGVDDDSRLEPVRGGDPPVLRILDGTGHLAGVRLGAQDRDEGRRVDDHAGSPCSS